MRATVRQGLPGRRAAGAVTAGVLIAVLLCLPRPATALPFEPGEQLQMTIRYVFVPVGELRVTVKETVDGGVRIWPVQGHARSRGLVGALYDIDDTFTTRLDPVTKRTLGSELIENFRDWHSKETITMNGASAQIHKEHNGNIRDSVESVPIGSRDLLAAVFALRDETLTKRTNIHIPIFSGIKSWELVADVTGEETITTAAGKFDTLLLRCRTTFGGKLKTNGDILVWLSRDARRIPVRIVAPLMIGHAEAELTSYQAGGQGTN